MLSSLPSTRSSVSGRVSGRSSGRSSSSRTSGHTSGHAGASGALAQRLSNRTSGVEVQASSESGSSGSSGRGGLGAGLVDIAPIPRPDPLSTVLSDPKVPERKRHCSGCNAAVGRSRGDRPGRTEGYCTHCGQAYSFSPKLSPGDIVGGQYEVVGCMAHGGLGWIYLAVDHRVNDKWVVLKGLLNTGDETALQAAVNERRFLAEVDHPNIVRIINFVEHPDLTTGSTDGYIVMDYVGGKSLKDIANERRDEQNRRIPLPVEQAIAYALEILPAMGYLHARGLLYCDFKIDNAIQQEDTIKIIDLGAVCRFDHDGDIFGTVGYQAPEVPFDGPSVSSDLYTVARTLAVLTFNFSTYTTQHQESLPAPDEVEIFRRYESFYRALVRATNPDPDRRFGSAEEMADQLTGVLREVLALHDDHPRPALSSLFAPEWSPTETEVLAVDGPPRPPATRDDPAPEGLLLTRRRARRRRDTSRTRPLPPGTQPRPARQPAPAPETNGAAVANTEATEAAQRPPELTVVTLDPWEAALALPVPHVDPTDPNSGFLASLSATVPRELLVALRSAPQQSVEKRLRQLRAHIELRELDEARHVMASLESEHAGDWRVIWYRGVTALVAGDLETAADAFDAVYDAYPGEAAPKLGLAVCAELLGEAADATECYRLVWTTDHTYVSAAFGLARMLLRSGERDRAVATLESVPETSSVYVQARIAAIRARLRGRAPHEALHHDLTASADSLQQLDLDSQRHEELTVEVLGGALEWELAGRPGTKTPPAPAQPPGTPSSSTQGEPGVPKLFGKQHSERELRFDLEHAFRVLARLSEDRDDRVTWVRQANRVRPRTWV